MSLQKHRDVKSREGPIQKYAPVLGLVAVLIFMLLYATLPSLKANRKLNVVRHLRLEEIRQIKQAEGRLQRLNDALETDPLTIEKQLRHQFGGVKGKREVEIPRGSE